MLDFLSWTDDFVKHINYKHVSNLVFIKWEKKNPLIMRLFKAALISSAVFQPHCFNN